MVKSFASKGLEMFWTTGSKKGIQPAHATKPLAILTQLNCATRPGEMDFPGWKFKALKNWGR